MVTDPKSKGAYQANICGITVFLEQHFGPPLYIGKKEIIMPRGISYVSTNKPIILSTIIINIYIQANATANSPLVIEFVSSIEVGFNLKILMINCVETPSDIRCLSTKIVAKK